MALETCIIRNKITVTTVAAEREITASKLYLRPVELVNPAKNCFPYCTPRPYRNITSPRVAIMAGG